MPQNYFDFSGGLPQAPNYDPTDRLSNSAINSITAGMFNNSAAPASGAGGFGQGILDFGKGVASGIGNFLKTPDPVATPDGKGYTVPKSGLEKALGVGSFGLQALQYKQLKKENEEAAEAELLKNRQNILGNISNVNMSMESNEYNRARNQGLSHQDATAQAQAHVAQRGLKAEQFGVQDFVPQNTTQTV